MKTLLLILSAVLSTLLAFGQPDPQLSTLTGKWIFVSYSEKDLGRIPESQLPILVFSDSSRKVSGSAGCNRINSSYEITGEHFAFGPMMSTFKACPDMEVERFITRFLPRVVSHKMEDNRLYLYDEEDKSSFVVFRRNASPSNPTL